MLLAMILMAVFLLLLILAACQGSGPAVGGTLDVSEPQDQEEK